MAATATQQQMMCIVALTLLSNVAVESYSAVENHDDIDIVFTSLSEDECEVPRVMLLQTEAKHDHRAVEHEQQHLDTNNSQNLSHNLQSDVGAASEVTKPNGPMGMNKTTMDQSSLPPESRHINNETYAADWQKEYPETDQGSFVTSSRSHAHQIGKPDLTSVMGMLLALIWSAIII